MAAFTQTNGVFEFGPYRLDPHSKVLLRDGTIVALTPKVLDTLLVLVENHGATVGKGELINAVWPDTFVEEGNLAQNISVLRKALGQNTEYGAYIETVPKRGYRFVAEVLIRHVGIPSKMADSLGQVPPPANLDLRTTVRSAVPLRARIGAALSAALILSGSIATFYYRKHVRDDSRIRSLAVLPLKNLSGDPAQEYFADGMTELLTAEISKALRVRVTSRTSAMRYRNSNKPLRVVAQELNVDAVVEGSVIHSGDRLRITTQLIHATSDRHLWAETYDRELTNVLVLQQEIARAIAHELQISTAPVRRSGSAPINHSAFEAYLRARYYLNERTAESIPMAISWYRKAIDEDPAYARAYAGLADCYNQLGTVMIGAQSPSESRKMAVAAATRALEIDPELAEAQAALGYSNLYDWKWDQAKAGLERAVALNPSYAPAHLWLAHYLAARAQFDQSLQQVRLARDLDPMSPIIQTQIGWILKFARRPAEAILEFRKALELEPGYPWATWQLGGTLAETGDRSSGIQILEKALERNHTPAALSVLGQAYGRAGRRRDAEVALGQLQALSQRRYVPPSCFVDVYCGLRDRDKVFEWLEKSYQERSNRLLWLGVEEDMDWLRSDPRLEDLLRRIGSK